MYLFHWRSLQPKYLLLMLVLGVFWCLARLPKAWVVALGFGLGRLIHRFSRKTRANTEHNLRLAFPAYSEQEYVAAVRQACLELGVAIMETAFIWFNRPDSYLEGRYEIEGREHWEAAMAQNKGIIVLICHIGSIDLMGALLTRLGFQGREVAATFRDTDPFVNDFLESKRTRLCSSLISSTDQRAVMRALRQKDIVWYASDIEVKNSGSAFVEFMGVKASTTLIVSRLAKSGKALVVPFAYYRDTQKACYRAKVWPALEGFPSADVEADTRRVNAMVEEMLAPQPMRYWWAIKRFKHKADGGRRSYR